MIDEPSAGQHYGGAVAAPVFSLVAAGTLLVCASPAAAQPRGPVGDHLGGRLHVGPEAGQSRLHPGLPLPQGRVDNLHGARLAVSHLAELGHMLCGEKEYVVQPDGTRIRDESGAPRQALHAEQLNFEHPFTGQPMRFRQQLPRDLSTWLDDLHRKHARPPSRRS